MPVHVEGLNQAPAATTTHTEPEGPVLVNSVASGTHKVVGIGDYVNTGNVAQTINLSVANLVGCSLVGIVVDDGTGAVPLPVTLAPGKKLGVFVEVKADDRPAGSPDEPLSFDVESVWS